MDKWTTTMSYGSSVLKKCAVLAFLLIGTAYSEPQANKPYKVCPEVVTAKDTPCRVATPTSAIVHRIEKPNEDKQKIVELEEKIKILEALLRELQSR